MQDKPLTETQTKVARILENLSPDEQQLLAKFLQAERDKLYMGSPRGIHEDLWRILTETVR